MLDTIFNYVFEIFFGYIVADLIIGVYHWIKDTYFDPHTPLLGGIFIWSSRLHHIRPQYVTTFCDYDLFISSAKWTLLWIVPVFYYVEFSLFTIVLFLTISLNDVVHKYAHMSDAERPEWATFLQNINVFQSAEEHHLHHTHPHITHYCPITPFVNTTLEKFDFWRKLEDLVEIKLGIKPRELENHFVEDKRYPAGIKFINKK
jgi:ubiquitin-conjugating enzyme E2 variant